jgi:hypothetical protein
MGADTVRQTMRDRADLQFRLEDPETPLDIR